MWQQTKIALPSIRSQWPVSTQTQTIDRAKEKLNSSADVKRPQTPNEMRLPSEHGRMMYWHMGNSKNAKATVAMTTKKIKTKSVNNSFFFILFKLYSLAVQTANSICIESKKKNMTSKDMEAPSGKHRACIVSNVANLSATHIKSNHRLCKLPRKKRKKKQCRVEIQTLFDGNRFARN